MQLISLYMKGFSDEPWFRPLFDSVGGPFLSAPVGIWYIKAI